LAEENPLEAPACADDNERPIVCPAAQDGHAGAHEHGGHQNTEAPEPALPPKAHDHDQHAAPGKAETPRPKANQPAKPSEGHEHHHHH
jgi:hypothetical protein